jgi:hypothetical protein
MPEEMEQLHTVMATAPVQETEQLKSSKLKLLPVTVTVVPTGPSVGESVIVALVRAKGTEIDPCCTYVALDMVTV